MTWLAILRIRHRLNARGKLGPNFSMAEEAAALAISATNQTRLLAGENAFRFANTASPQMNWIASMSSDEDPMAT